MGGECCVRHGDGTFSAYPLQQQMIEGVDDSDIRAKTRRMLLERGMPPRQVDMLLPDLRDGPGSDNDASERTRRDRTDRDP